MNTLAQQSRADKKEIVRALKLYADGPAEIRIIDGADGGGRPDLFSGFFDDIDAAAMAIGKLSAWAGVYVTLNPILPALLARCKNRLARVGKRGGLTSDKDIIALRWLPIDIDAVRPAGISSTDNEHEAALALMARVVSYLAENSWPDPIMVDSGNGAHALYRIDLPADDAELVKRTLAALDEEFSTDTVKVDLSVFNPARIFKLPGTLVCKGDSTADRPHRMARIISAPAALTLVLPWQLEHIAAQAQPKPAAARKPAQAHGGTFDIDGWIAQHEPNADGPDNYNGGRKWILPTCAFDPSHTGGCAVIIEMASGALSYRCLHNSCTGYGWMEYRSLREPGHLRAKLPTGSSHAHDPGETIPDYGDAGDGDTPAMALAIEDAADIIRDCPELRPEVVGDLGRVGEVLTVIAMSKSAKTYLLILLALCKAVGRMFLGRFQTMPAAKVLLIDCELHRQTLARRIHAVAKAMGIQESEYRGRLKVISLRGRLRDLNQLDPMFRGIAHGEYGLIIIDPLFRIYPPGTNENDNAHLAAIFNQLDRYSEMTGAMFAISHHSSKGNQTAKNAMDVGAGAGSWARSVDTLIVLRPHEEDNAAVAEVIARSFPPLASFVVRWEYPLWRIDSDLDATQLRQAGERGKAAGAGWTPERFAVEMLNGKATPRNVILAKAAAAGLPRRKSEELFGQAVVDGFLDSKQDEKDGRKIVYFRPKPNER